MLLLVSHFKSDVEHMFLIDNFTMASISYLSERKPRRNRLSQYPIPTVSYLTGKINAGIVHEMFAIQNIHILRNNSYTPVQLGRLISATLVYQVSSKSIKRFWRRI